MPAGRIEVEGRGVGELDSGMIALRAAEIAASNGRALPNDQDFAEARKELAGRQYNRPSELEALHIDDVAAVDRGHGAESSYATEETNSTRLVEEGIEEADRDQRVESAREQARELAE